MQEIWKTIKEAPNYEISNLGNVRHVYKIASPRPVIAKKHYISGYYQVGLLISQIIVSGDLYTV